MIMDLNAYPSPFPIVPSKYDDQDQELHPFVPNNQASSSSFCAFFHTIQDQTGCYQPRLCPLQHHQDHSYTYNGGYSSTYEVKCKKEDPGDMLPERKWKNVANPVKLMSSKMRLTQKMKKNHDGFGLNVTSNCTTKRSSYNLGTYSSNSISSLDNIPIRVCSDCNTTKTPLWRTGPKGPKSLCNACGIKQRKARRAAMAAAAADKPRTLVKIKMQHKEKATGKNLQASLLMKRSKMEQSAANIAAGSKSNGQEKLSTFEDLLMKMRKNLAFYSVFPEDEKDAAILLMALSSGLLHG